MRAALVASVIFACSPEPAALPQIEVPAVAGSAQLVVTPEAPRTPKKKDPFDVLPCSEEGAIRSGRSEVPAVVRFVDDLDGVVEFFWLDFDGNRVPYGVVVINSSYRQQTYTTHPWILIHEGRCIGIVVPNEPGTHDIVISKVHPRGS